MIHIKMNGNSENSLEKLHNKYEGERLFIIGNGPSLDETPLEQLESEYTFALNKINHIYDQISWRPTFYLFLITSSYEENREFVIENINSGCICFLNDKHKNDFGERNNTYYINEKKLPADPLTVAGVSPTDIEQVEISQISEVWEYDITQGVYKQHSMYPILQIVLYLGFDEIYFLGCDLGYEVQKPYLLFESGIDPCKYPHRKKDFLTDSIHEQKLIRSAINGLAFKLMLTRPVDYILRRWTNVHSDGSHFTESYSNKIKFKDVNQEITNSHRVAKRVLNEYGVSVYNATVGGELEVYPRVDLEDIVDGS